MAVKIARKGTKPAPAPKKAPAVKTKAKPVDDDEEEDVKSTISVSELRKEAAKAEAKPVKAKKVEVVSDDTVTDLRRAYKSFTQTWLDFAVKLHEVYHSDSWKEYSETWSDFCAQEFPDISLGVISKFLRVADDWGKVLLELREKRPEAILPAYDACYDLTVAARSIPPSELPKLRKDLLEHKITRPELREILEPYRKAHVDRAEKEETKSAKAEEKKIEKEVEAEVESKKEVVKEDVELAADIDKELASDVDSSAKRMLDKVEYLIDHLPLLSSVVEEAGTGVVLLAEKCEELQQLIEDYLVKVEKISTKEK